MKKLITIASLLIASASYAASEVTINATLNVIDPTQDVLVSFDTTALDFGTEVITANTFSSNTMNIKVTGTEIKAASLVFPQMVDITNGTETINTSIVVGSVTGGTASTSGSDHKITSGASSEPNMSVPLNAQMILAGNEAPGLYSGTMNVVAQYE